MTTYVHKLTPDQRREAGGFVAITNATPNDHRLSFDALGVLTYILSKGPGWIVTEEDIRGAASGAIKQRASSRN